MTAFLKNTRRFKRFKSSLPVTFNIQSPSVKLRGEEKVEGFIEDISAGGALIKTPVFIPKGSVVVLNINVKDLIPDLPIELNVESKIMHTQAKVISLAVEKKKTFKMGVQFLSLTSEQRQIINDFIEKKIIKTKNDKP